MRTTIVLPPNRYRNMNAASILKNHVMRHEEWKKRYTSGSDAARHDDPAAQVRDDETVEESPYFCVA